MARTIKAADERRNEFISTAQQLFYTKGYAGTSVNDIINAVGVSKGAFYHHFDSKQVLLEEVIHELTEQSRALTQVIVADPNLDAIAKFNRMMSMIGNWKIEHKDELLALMHILYMDENLRLFHQLRTEGAKIFAPQLAKIIIQGIEEQVFNTESPSDAATFAVALIRSIGEEFADILFNQTIYEDPVSLMQRKINAAQTALERILDAPKGSLQFIDPGMAAAWFE